MSVCHTMRSALWTIMEIFWQVNWNSSNFTNFSSSNMPEKDKRKKGHCEIFVVYKALCVISTYLSLSINVGGKQSGSYSRGICKSYH